jgi:hypothetical protein
LANCGYKRAALYVDKILKGIVVYDHSFTVDRAWFRFSFQWPDPKTGEKQSRAGMQSYRIEDGKLVETWITMRQLGTSWTDVAQEHWTNARK